MEEGLRGGSPDWTRTSNPSINSRMLCQLSYGGMYALLRNETILYRPVAASSNRIPATTRKRHTPLSRGHTPVRLRRCSSRSSSSRLSCWYSSGSRCAFNRLRWASLSDFARLMCISTSEVSTPTA